MLQRFFLLAFIAMLMAGPCRGQKKKESYQQKESYKKSLSSRTSAGKLVDEAEALKASNPDAALDKVQQALAICVAQGDDFNEGRSYILLAEVNEDILEWKLAHENYLRAKNKLASYPSSPAYVQTLRGLGDTALKLRDYTSALKHYQDALTLRLSEAERMEITIAVSEVHYQMRSYEEALGVLDSADHLNKIQNPQFENQCQKINVRLNGLDTNQNLYSNSLNAIRSGNIVSFQEQQSVQQTKDEIVDVLQENKL